MTFGWLSVQTVVESVPRVGSGLMVMEYVPVAVAPMVSRTVNWTLLYVPAVVGVPLMVMMLPLSEADRPAGNPVALTTAPGGGAVFTRGIVPEKPGWFTVQAVDESDPRIPLRTSRMRLLFWSAK